MSFLSPIPRLPAYCPPPDRDAAIAACVAPLIVLALFVLVVCKLIGLPAMLAALMACLGWLVTEMWTFDTALHAYNAEYAASWLARHSTRSLEHFIAQADTDEKTREFVKHYLEAGREVLRSGQLSRPLE